MWTFPLFGFRVVVATSFLVVTGVFALIALQAGASLPEAMVWPIVVFGSILVHELGHAFVAQGFGLGVGEIHLHGLGGHVSHTRTGPARQLAISLAGPLAGILFGCLVLVFAWVGMPEDGAPAWLTRTVDALLYVNIGWSLFNLLPVLPLDGGNALLAASTAAGLTERRAVRLTAAVGFVLSTLGLGYALTAGLWWITFLFGMFLWNNLQNLQIGAART
jgi:Zn-dependent protease